MHNFKLFPELTNAQVPFYYAQSPHTQIFRDFRANVQKVTDGDTIRVTCDFRDFNFPIRLADINTEEMAEGGAEAKEWLKNRIEGLEVIIEIDHKNRVGKYGRLIGKIISNGMNINHELIIAGHAKQFSKRNEDKFFNINTVLNIDKW